MLARIDSMPFLVINSTGPRYVALEGYSGEGNIDVDPLFITGPFGDYYLSQSSAGQTFTSGCVDSGSTSSSSLGMNEKTTRTDSVTDSGTVDMGYHYNP